MKKSNNKEIKEIRPISKMVIVKKAKILFVCPYFSSFIQNDLDLLKKHFDVKIEHYTGLRSIPKILKGVLWSDITFSWFADTHAFWAVLLSKIFRKKSIVVVGGFEVANVPEINYGLMLSPISARRVKYVLENADKVLTVSDSLKMDAINNAGVNGKNIHTVHSGCDSNKWEFEGEKEDLTISVSVGNTWNRARLKGLDVFVESAKFLPAIKFLVIGIQGKALEKLKYIASCNVDFVDPLSQDELIPYYQRAKVYCQLSIREGFGNSACEAMLCECVPVGTKRGGIPTVIGDAGFYVPYGDPKATAEAIKKALQSGKGEVARERIKNMFPIEKREKELKEMINNIMLRDVNKEDIDYDEQK